MKSAQKIAPDKELSLRYLSQKEVSQILGMSEAWLERKRWEGGGIPYKKFGSCIRYLEADVLAWITSQPTRTNSIVHHVHC